MAFWPEDDVNHLRLVYTTRYAERKPGLDKSGLLTLHNFVLSIDLYVKSRVYKAFPDNRGGASHWKDWFPPCGLFSLSLLFWLNSHLGRGGSPCLLTYSGF